MKALISPNEFFTHYWISSWVKEGTKTAPIYSQIEGCQRVAEVQPDANIFEVAQPLHWVACPDSCLADEWYFKDGQCTQKPTNAPMPTVAVEEMP
jgi:hypothetical protein